MNRRFLIRVTLFACLYYLVFLSVKGLIFLFSHVPPGSLNLSWAISLLGGIQHVLAWPRPLLRQLWPGESSPAMLNIFLQIVNCLLWGLALAGLKSFLARARK